MIIDITGVELTPGNRGKDCLGNGEHRDSNGNIIECCCDECDYLICCTVLRWKKHCLKCENINCPRFEQKMK